MPSDCLSHLLPPSSRSPQVVVKHDTGMGESYMDGDYEVDDFGGFLAVAVANANGIEDSRGLLGIFNWLGDRLLYLSHLRRPNTIHGSRKNIEEHYDAGGGRSLRCKPLKQLRCKLLACWHCSRMHCLCCQLGKLTTHLRHYLHPFLLLPPLPIQ
jgi:hypothetical protein